MHGFVYRDSFYTLIIYVPVNKTNVEYTSRGWKQGQEMESRGEIIFAGWSLFSLCLVVWSTKRDKTP